MKLQRDDDDYNNNMIKNKFFSDFLLSLVTSNRTMTKYVEAAEGMRYFSNFPCK